MSVDTNLEKLRLTIGDTEVTDAALFKDAELNWFLSEESNIIANAALRAAYAAMAKFARAYDFETDGQSYKRSQQYTAWADFAKRLEQQGATVATATTSIITVDVTKVDGWSEDIANQEVSVASSNTNPRRKYYNVGGLDQVP